MIDRVASKSRERVDGTLVLDKPAGITSNRALQEVKKLFNARKAGHCGTLDPFATGLLPVCFGEATKFSRFVLDSEKTYKATLRLGETTTTGDTEGEIVNRATVSCGEEEIRRTLRGFIGKQTQTPPMFSAIKRNGTPLYALARKGVEVERSPRDITVSGLRLVSLRGDELEIEVRCSKGTYIRVLAEDIGAALGCGAHVTGLRRTTVGELDLECAQTLDGLQHMTMAERELSLLPVDHFLRDMPKIDLDTAQAARVRHGQPLAVEAEPGVYRCYHDGFLGIASVDRSGRLSPMRLVSSAAFT